MSKVKMGDICDFYNGGAWSDKEYVASGLPVLKVSNCKNSGFQIEEVNFLPVSSKEKYAKNQLYKGDVIIATVGSHPNLIESAAGRSCVVNSLVEGFYLNQNAVCLRTKDKEILNQEYLGYLCKEKSFQHFIQNKGRGAANQMRIAIGGIKEYEFNLPDINVQRKLGEFLSTYDGLIENNKKQIKLLEEAAQRLYKEWFVDLHFPGYEDVEIVDGVPEGWKIHPIDDVFQIKYGKTLPTSKISSEGKYPVYGANGIIGFYSEKNIDDYVVLITSRGNGSGDVLITHDKESFVTNNSFIVTPINHYVRLPFIHQLMKCTGFKNICTGSAQPQLTNKSISTLCVLMPSYDLISRFCETESVWYEKIEKLLTQNKLLNQARDRLLPKLMSGEIEV